MKGAVAFTLAASLAAGAVAHNGHHGHQHFHVKKNNVASPVEKRDAETFTKWVVDATETVYVLEGKVVDIEEAEERMDGGELVIIGESTPTFTPPPAPEATTSSQPEMGAQFFESEASSEPETTSTPEPEPTTTSEAPKPTKKASSSGSGSSSSFSGAEGVDRDFLSGEVPCDEFPSAYGARALDWLELGGWSSLQRAPKFSFGVKAIDEIHTGIKGEGCTEGSFCSYACPEGYQKTQWPEAQGATGQSIGGLWCNSKGMLELTRKKHTKLCEKGAGGVYIQNDLDEVVNTCRTDYPGTEAMVIPAQALPGSKVEACSVDQDNYYEWQGSKTTAQWYINKKGYSLENACVWTSPIDEMGAGDRSPAILGLGKTGKFTYIGLFQNLPMGKGQKLDFNIEIIGDLEGDVECGYKNGQWIGGETGCTATVREGNTAIVRYY